MVFMAIAFPFNAHVLKIGAVPDNDMIVRRQLDVQLQNIPDPKCIVESFLRALGGLEHTALWAKRRGKLSRSNTDPFRINA